MQLSPEERTDLAEELLASVGGGGQEDVEAAWAQEIERRARRVLAGETQGTDWSVVRERVSEAIKRR